MPTDKQEMARWCRTLLGAGDAKPLALEDYLQGIPRLDSLSDVPRGTIVLVRGDVDAKPGATVGEGDIRLRSMLDTLQFGRKQGWKQVVLGHIGRKPEGSLDKVARRLGELLKAEVPLVTDWLDEASMRVTDSAAATIASSAPGSVLVLENTRRYNIERVLWKAKADDADKLAEPLAKLANTLAERIGSVYVNEALSAGSLDASSTIVPAGMDRVALGAYVASEFDGPMLRCRNAQLVVFSGLKTDKLDDLQAMIERGKVRWIISGGSLAMALKKAEAELAGGEFSLGVAEHDDHHDKPYYISRERIDQARRMLAAGKEKGIQFVLPVDFVLADGQVSETIGPGQQQFDIGPASSKLYEEKIGQFIAESKQGIGPAVAFHNGVFGMFEDQRFAGGTERFIPQLKRMKESGIEVYVGGGEGGTALEKYGSDDWVTHVFTAGGTVLNALGSQPVPYLQALHMAARS